MTDNIATAEAIILKLEDKRRALVEKATELADERQRIAFNAHTGDTKARKRLDEITAATVAHNSEMCSIEAAIAEANIRLATAKADAALAADRANAELLRELVKELAELGTEIDAAFTDAAAHLASLATLLNKIHSLGCPSPTHDQLRVLGANAVKTYLMALPFPREFEHLAPSSRRTFDQVVHGWVTMLERNIADRLGDNQGKAA
jgi:dTDP-4-amino-4,6-dideoxygalactose transaminase